MGQPPWPVIVTTASMYTASTSGRSSRSTLMQTKCSFITCAVPSSPKDSRSITWHQWHPENPIESRIGLSSSRARASASSLHSHQATGLCACWRRYGLVAAGRRFTPALCPTDGALRAARAQPPAELDSARDQRGDPEGEQQGEQGLL